MEEEKWLEEIIYNGENLLELDGTVLNKYVIMETLFTREELNTGLIKGEGSRSKKEKLDDQKVDILKDAVKHKFRVPMRRMATTWREVQTIAKRCCYHSIKKN